MRCFCLSHLLTGCAVLALAAPAVAQDAPIIIDPPLNPSAREQPIVVPPPGVDAPEPDKLHPPLVVPTDEPAVESTEPPVTPIPAVWAPVPRDAEGQSAYGLYLSGRLASIRGDRTVGARLLAESQALAPEQPVIGEEAFKSGLFAGDLSTVARLTGAVQDTPMLAELGRMVELVEHLRAGEARAGLAMLRDRPFAPPYSVAVRYLTPSIAAAAGDWEAALRPVSLPAGDAASLIMHQQRAGLLESRRRYDEADAEYRILMAAPGGTGLFAMDYAAFLERRNRRDEALALYDAALTGRNPDSEAAVGRARVLGRKRAPAMPTLLERAATALEFAAFETTQGQIDELSAIYLRMAESLAPNDTIIYQLAQSLAASGQNASAREAFARVGPSDPVLYARAQVGLAEQLTAADQDEAALGALRRADAAVPDQAAFTFTLAQQLTVMGRHEEALEVLNRPTMNVAGQPAAFHFLRGAALESLDRLDEAENELWAALQQQPDDPGVLNYLGYMWVDSGRRVEQGAEMLARAHAAEPSNGNIQDSLGWAQFRQGQYDVAVTTLEGAVGKLPGNPEIVDHLGDAYWQVGRRREAEWQWSRVLTLAPDAERRAEVERKLADGLPEPTPVADDLAS